MSQHGVEGSMALALDGRNFVANLREFCDKIEHECDSLQKEITDDPISSTRTRSGGVKSNGATPVQEHRMSYMSRSDVMDGMRFSLKGINSEIEQIRNNLGAERPLKELNDDLREEKSKLEYKVGKLVAYLQDYGYEKENKSSCIATKSKSTSLKNLKSNVKERKTEVLQRCDDIQDITTLETEIRENKRRSGLAHQENAAAGAKLLECLSLDGPASPVVNLEREEEARCESSQPDTDTNNENSSPILSPVYNVSLQDLSLSKATLAALAGAAQEDSTHQQDDPTADNAMPLRGEKEEVESSSKPIQTLRGTQTISESDLAGLPRFLTRSITVDSLNKEIDFANEQLRERPEGLSNEEFTRRGLGGSDIKRSRQILLTLVKLNVLMTHVNDSGDVVYKKYQ